MKRPICILFFLLAWFSTPLVGQERGEFPYPSPPAFLSNEDAVAEWKALHFWDCYDFAQTESLYSAETNRTAFFDFLSVLYQTTPQHCAEAIGAMMDGAAESEDSYWYFLEMAEVVLYDPTSPMRNDLLWEHFLTHSISPRSPLDDLSKGRYISLLEIVSRNQQGDVATDFTYTLADGREGQLHTIEAPFTLLYFYNTDCGECARVRETLRACGYLDALHLRGVIEVLALHPDGDMGSWYHSLGENPDWWITAYDKRGIIREKELYDLKAIPTIYLLDAQKCVVMKDPTVEDLVVVLGDFASKLK